MGVQFNLRQTLSDGKLILRYQEPIRCPSCGEEDIDFIMSPSPWPGFFCIDCGLRTLRRNLSEMSASVGEIKAYRDKAPLPNQLALEFEVEPIDDKRS